MELLPKFSSSINSAFKARPSSSFFFFLSRRRTILFALVVVQLVLLRSTASAARRKENEGHLRSTTTTTTPTPSSSSSSSSSPPPAPPLPSLPPGAVEDSGGRKGGRKGGKSQEHERGKTKLSPAQLPLRGPGARYLTSLLGRGTRGRRTGDSSSSPPPPPPPPPVSASSDYVGQILQRVFSPRVPSPDVLTSMSSVTTTTSTPTSPRSRHVPRPTSPPPPPPASASGAFRGAAGSSPSSRQGRSRGQGAQGTMTTEDTTATASHRETASPRVHGEEESRRQQTGTGSQAGAIASPSPEGEQEGRRSPSEGAAAGRQPGQGRSTLWRQFKSLLRRTSDAGKPERPREKPGETTSTPHRRHISVSSPKLVETTAMIPSASEDLRQKLSKAGSVGGQRHASLSTVVPGWRSSPQERQQGSRQQPRTPTKPLEPIYDVPPDAKGAPYDRYSLRHASSSSSFHPPPPPPPLSSHPSSSSSSSHLPSGPSSSSSSYPPSSGRPSDPSSSSSSPYYSSTATSPGPSSSSSYPSSSSSYPPSSRSPSDPSSSSPYYHSTSTSPGPSSSSSTSAYAVFDLLRDSTGVKESKGASGISEEQRRPSMQMYKNVIEWNRRHRPWAQPGTVSPYAQTVIGTPDDEGGEQDYSLPLDAIKLTSSSGASRRQHDPSASPYLEDDGDDGYSYDLPYDAKGRRTTGDGAPKGDSLSTPAHVNVGVGIGEGSQASTAGLEAAAASGQAAAAAPEEPTPEEEAAGESGDVALEEESAAVSGAVAAPERHIYENDDTDSEGYVREVHQYDELTPRRSSGGASHDDNGEYEEVDYKSASSAAPAGKGKHKRRLRCRKHKRGEGKGKKKGLFLQIRQRLGRSPPRQSSPRRSEQQRPPSSEGATGAADNTYEDMSSQ